MRKKLISALLLAGLLTMPRPGARHNCPECTDPPEFRRVERLAPLDLRRPEATCGRLMDRP